MVARDLEYLRQQFRDAFAYRSAADMETRLNAVGVAAARVRKVGEFLREVDGGEQLPLPGLCFQQNGRVVRTPGLGFRYAEGDSGIRPGAPALGQSNAELLDQARMEQACSKP